MRPGQDWVDSHRFENAIRRFDEENALDPNSEASDGKSYPRELLYARWLTEWVMRLDSKASETLLLAARSAHLCRWCIPRDSYPATRSGYLRWRSELKRFHAQRAGEILREVGYSQETIERVQSLISKSGFPADPESRILEDGLCLIFLERQFAALASKASEEKIINALQKTWQKMTPAAREFALKLQYGARESALLERALNPPK